MSATARSLLLAYVFFLPLLPEEFGFRSKSLPDMSFVRFFLLLLAISLIAGLVFDGKFKRYAFGIFKDLKVPVFFVSLYLLWLFIASLLSPSGIATIFAAIRDAMYFAVPFFAALFCLRSLKDIQTIALVVAVSAMISGGIGIFEYTTGFSLYGELTAGDSPWNTLNEHEYKGALSTFPHPLAFGAFLVGSLILSTLLLVGTPSGVMVGSAAIFVAVAGIIASSSRGALAGLAAAMAWFGILQAQALYRRVKRSQKVVAFIVITLPIVLITVSTVTYVGFKLIKGSNVQQEGSSAMRVLQMQLAVPKISERPILGYGAGKAAEVLGMKANTVDVYYLTVALESGLLGLLFFLWMLVYYFARSVSAFRVSGHKYFLIMSMFFVAEGVQLLVLSLKQAIPLLYVGFALLLVMQRKFKTQNLRKEARHV